MPHVREQLGRRWWTLQRFGLAPPKLARRLANRTEPRVLCVSVPKSGTHLLERALCLHPRLYRKLRPTIRFPELAKLNGFDAVVASLGPGQVLMAHLHFLPEFLPPVEAREVSLLFLIRDPRDVVLSEARFLATQKDHRLHALFAGQPTFKDMVLLAINGDPRYGVVSIGKKLSRYAGWLESGAHVVRFEGLIGSTGGADDAEQAGTLRDLFDSVGLAADPSTVQRIQRRLFSRNSPTFRGGQVGGWRTHFDPEVQAAFDAQAGGFMRRYGYSDRSSDDPAVPPGPGRPPQDAASSSFDART